MPLVAGRGIAGFLYDLHSEHAEEPTVGTDQEEASCERPAIEDPPRIVHHTTSIQPGDTPPEEDDRNGVGDEESKERDHEKQDTLYTVRHHIPP